jgi:hypothetical protein
LTLHTDPLRWLSPRQIASLHNLLTALAESFLSWIADRQEYPDANGGGVAFVKLAGGLEPEGQNRVPPLSNDAINKEGLSGSETVGFS